MNAVVSRDRLLTVTETAQWFTVSPAWIRDHSSGRRRPLLPSIQLGKLRRFRSGDVQAFIEECARFAPQRGQAA